MGNQSCSFPKILSNDFQVPNLKDKNDYGQSEQKINSKYIQAIFAQSSRENLKSKVAQIIEKNQQTFIDNNFIIDSKQKTRLSVLFDFKRMKTHIYETNSDYDLTNFVQLEIEYSYLSTVFYLLCRKQIRKSFIKRIIQNQEVNKYGAYVLNFFCNGERHQIVIDDQMPTKSDSFIYTRIVKGIQLWPLIIEKAWCKQIGSYQKAKGLSPEDAFDQIIGAPAYTYTFEFKNRKKMQQILQQAQKFKYWVALVARKQLQDLKNRQVFYLQQLDDHNNCLIISPYSSYRFQKYQQHRRGEIKVNQQDLFTHFEYAVIGYYRQGYENKSIPVISKNHEQLLFQLNIEKEQQISIRFNQFYSGYLKQQERINYKYSPILIELYKIHQKNGTKNYQLVSECQGCDRSCYGARSIFLTKKIFVNLKGKYFIRIQVNWQHEQLLNKGNLIVYATKGNANITQLKNNTSILTEIYQSIFQKQTQKQNQEILNQQNLEIKFFNKENTSLFLIKNLINSIQMFTLQFKNGKNIKIRGGTVNKNKTSLTLEAKKQFIIQIFPLDIRIGMSFDGVEIIRNDIKQ